MVYTFTLKNRTSNSFWNWHYILLCFMMLYIFKMGDRTEECILSLSCRNTQGSLWKKRYNLDFLHVFWNLYVLFSTNGVVRYKSHILHGHQQIPILNICWLLMYADNCMDDPEGHIHDFQKQIELWTHQMTLFSMVVPFTRRFYLSPHYIRPKGVSDVSGYCWYKAGSFNGSLSLHF